MIFYQSLLRLLIVSFLFVAVLVQAEEVCSEKVASYQKIVNSIDDQLQGYRRAMYVVNKVSTVGATQKALYVVTGTILAGLERVSFITGQPTASIILNMFNNAYKDYKKNPTLEGLFIAYLTRIALSPIGAAKDMADGLQKMDNVKLWKYRALNMLSKGEVKLLEFKNNTLFEQFKLPCFVSKEKISGFGIESEDGKKFNHLSSDGVSLVSLGPQLAVGHLAKLVIWKALGGFFGGHKNGYIFAGDLDNAGLMLPKNDDSFIWDLDIIGLRSNEAVMYSLISERRAETDIVLSFRRLGKGMNISSSIYSETLKKFSRGNFGVPMSLMQSKPAKPNLSEKLILFQANESGLVGFRLIQPEFAKPFMNKTFQQAVRQHKIESKKAVKINSKQKILINKKIGIEEKKLSEKRKIEIRMQENGLLRNKGLFPGGDTLIYYDGNTGTSIYPLPKGIHLESDTDISCGLLCNFYSFSK